jgi:hypothetical protein
MVDKLREGMARDYYVVQGILSHCCGREAMPVSGETARTAERRRRDADIRALTLPCCRRSQPVARRPSTHAMRLRPPARRPVAGRRAWTRSRRGCEGL